MNTPQRDPLVVLAAILGLGLLAWVAIRPTGTPTGLPTADLSAIESGLDRLIQTLERNAASSGAAALPATKQTPERAAGDSPRQVLPDTAALRRELERLRAQVLALSRQPGQAVANSAHLLPPDGQRIQRLDRAYLALRDPDKTRHERLRQEFLLLREHQVLMQLGKPTGIYVSKNGYEMWTYKFKNPQGQDKDLSLKVTNGRVINVF